MKTSNFILIFALCLLGTPAYASENIKIEGTVKHGETFEKVISRNLVFRLIPQDYGWDIAVGDKIHPKDNFSSVVTPPYRGMSQVNIAGWHFRNTDNSGPNESGPKNVNAPADERDFEFVLNDRDFKIAMNALQRLLWSYSFNEKEVDKARVAHEHLKKGHGTLTIHDLKLNNLQVGQHAGIDAMQFEVELKL